MSEDNGITDLLRTAYESVTAAGVPEALRAVAFEKAVDLLAVRAGVALGAPLAPALGEKKSKQTPPTAGESKTLAKVAAKLGLSEDTVGEVFHIDGETLSLGVGTSMLAPTKAKATEQIALLIAAARQAGGWDAEWTAVGEIRPVADAYGKFDSGNFATTIKDMDKVFSFSGNGPSRKVKVRRKGFEDAATLVKKLAGEEDS